MTQNVILSQGAEAESGDCFLISTPPPLHPPVSASSLSVHVRLITSSFPAVCRRGAVCRDHHVF